MMKTTIASQISEFRSWPNDKTGCLFYLASFTKIRPYANALVIIESDWRKEDEIGSFDKLHAVEWNQIAPDNCIAQGYTAFIINLLLLQARGSHSDIFNEDALDLDGKTTARRMWKNYCDQYRAALFEKTTGDMIEQEAYALINAKWDIIADYINIPKDDIAWMLAVPIMDWLNEPEARYCDAAKNLTLNLPLPESGIKAFIALAAVADAIAFDFENTFPSESFDAIQKLVSLIWDGTPSARKPIDYDEIKIRPLNEIRNIYETYTDRMMPLCHAQIRISYPTYAILEDEQKDAKALAFLFTREWEHAQTEAEFEKKLNRKERQGIKVGTRYFFKYLLTRLKHFDEEYNFCYRLIYPQKQSEIIPEKKQPFCTYTVPNALKSREEVEIDLVRASKKSASTFARLLLSYMKYGYLDFRGEDPSEIFEYLQKRYDITHYQSGNFCRYFK